MKPFWVLKVRVFIPCFWGENVFLRDVFLIFRWWSWNWAQTNFMKFRKNVRWYIHDRIDNSLSKPLISDGRGGYRRGAISTFLSSSERGYSQTLCRHNENALKWKSATSAFQNTENFWKWLKITDFRKIYRSDFRDEKWHRFLRLLLLVDVLTSTYIYQ